MRPRALNVGSIVRASSVAAAVFWCAVSVPKIALAQDKTWDQLLAAGQKLQSQGRYAEAESSFQAALDRAKALPEPLAAARSMNYLGAVKQIRGEYSAAEALYASALDICGQHPAPLEKAAILLNQARLFGAEGKLNEAEVVCGRSLRSIDPNLGRTIRALPTRWTLSPLFNCAWDTTRKRCWLLRSRWRSARKRNLRTTWILPER